MTHFFYPHFLSICIRLSSSGQDHEEQTVPPTPGPAHFGNFWAFEAQIVLLLSIGLVAGVLLTLAAMCVWKKCRRSPAAPPPPAPQGAFSGDLTLQPTIEELYSRPTAGDPPAQQLRTLDLH